MRAAARLVLAARAHDPRVERFEVALEVFAAEVLIADQDQHLAGQPLATSDHLQADDFLVELRRGQRERPGRAVHREQGVQPETPEVAAVAGAVPVVSGVGERVAETRVAAAFDGLTRPGALHRRRVDEQHIVNESGAQPRELGDQCLDHDRQPEPALVKRGALRQARKEVPDLAARRGEEPWVRRDAHHRLRNAERHDLGIGDLSASVTSAARQKIVRCAINSDQQQIEVGVHRGPQGRRSLQSTVDFDLSAYVSCSGAITPPAVALLI